MLSKYKTVLQRAKGKKDEREYFNYVYVKDDDVVSTNGHILVIFKNVDNLTDGFYDKNFNPIKIKSDDNKKGDYPNYMQVMLSAAEFKEKAVEINFAPSEAGRLIINGVEIDVKYYNIVKDLIKYNEVVVDKNSPYSHSVNFHTKDFKIKIMGFGL